MDSNVSKYLTQQIMTASPAQLVYLLLDKAISSLNEAILAIEEGDVARRWKANNRATEIVSHLWSTLDREKGGQIADNLDQLYGFILRQLPAVDIQNDPQPARDAIGLLTPLRESWREIAAKGAAAGQTQGRAQAQGGTDQTAAPGEARPRTIVEA